MLVGMKVSMNRPKQRDLPIAPRKCVLDEQLIHFSIVRKGLWVCLLCFSVA